MDNLPSPSIAAGVLQSRGAPASRATAHARSGSVACRVRRAAEGQGISAMSTVLENKPAARGGVADKLAFFNGLQAVTNKIHATSNIDEIMLESRRRTSAACSTPTA